MDIVEMTRGILLATAVTTYTVKPINRIDTAGGGGVVGRGWEGAV